MKKQNVGLAEVKMALILGVGSPMFSGVAGGSTVSAQISQATGKFVAIDDQQAAERFALFSAHLQKVEAAQGELDAMVQEFGTDHTMYSVLCGSQSIMFRGPALDTVKAALLAEEELSILGQLSAPKSIKPRGAL